MTVSEKARLNSILKGNIITIMNVQDLIAEIEGRVEEQAELAGYQSGNSAERPRY